MKEELQPVEPESDPEEEFDAEMMGLIAAHQNDLLAFLRSLIPSEQDPEDVLQNANIVLWRKRKQFELGTNFKAWSFSVARWEALSCLKDAKRKNWLLFDSEIASLVEEDMYGQARTRWSEWGEELDLCLGMISEKNNQLLRDRYERGMTVEECAKKWNRSEGGLRVTLHRLRLSIRQCMEKKMKES